MPPKRKKSRARFLTIVSSGIVALLLIFILCFMNPFSPRISMRWARQDSALIEPSLLQLEMQVKNATTYFDAATASENEIETHLSTLSTLKNQVKNLGVQLESYNKKRKSAVFAFDSAFNSIKNFVEEKLQYSTRLNQERDEKTKEKMQSSLNHLQEKVSTCLKEIEGKEEKLCKRLQVLEESQKSFIHKKEVQAKCNALSQEIAHLMTVINKNKQEFNSKIETLIPASKQEQLKSDIKQHLSILETKLTTISSDFEREKKKMLASLNQQSHESARKIKHTNEQQKKELSTFIVNSLETKMKELRKLFDAEQNTLLRKISYYTPRDETNELDRKVKELFNDLNDKIKAIHKKNNDLAEQLTILNRQLDLKLEKEKKQLTEHFDNKISNLDASMQAKYKKLDDQFMSTLESKISSTEARLESQINHTFYKLQKQLSDLEYKLNLTKKLNKRIDNDLISRREIEPRIYRLDNAISSSSDISSFIKNTVKKELYVSEEALKQKERKSKQRKHKIAELITSLTADDD